MLPAGGLGLGCRGAGGIATFGDPRARTVLHTHLPALHRPRRRHHRQEAHLHDEEDHKDTEVAVADRHRLLLSDRPMICNESY